MKLTALRLHNVRRFAGRGVAIEGMGEGVNVLSAANEQGKSTAFEALHALFFQPHGSTGKAVQLLRPYSGGSPLVEADIVTAEGRFRLTKQFYGGKRARVLDLDRGRLVAQADEAEAFLAELTRGGAGGPAGLLWVRQGITGMDRRSNSEEEGERRVRETLLTSVQGEVEALTGGRRMAKILAACEAELAPLVTAGGRPKAGGFYALALDDMARLEAEETRLAADVAVLREALEKRRATRKRLAELEDPDAKAERRAATLAAEAAFEAAKRHGEALRTAQAEAELARNRHVTAAELLRVFDADLIRAGDLAHKVDAAQRRRDEAVTRRSRLMDEQDEARQAVAAAEQQEREHRALLARLDAALGARMAGEHLGRLQERLEKAEVERTALEADEASLAAIDIDPAGIRQLQELEVEILRLRVAEEARLPSLRIDYSPGGEGKVLLSGAPLPGGKDLGFAATTPLDIEGIGRLVLRIGATEPNSGALAKAEARRRALLDRLGVESLAAAQSRLALAQDKAAAVKLARQRLADLAPQGLGVLQAETARLAAAQSPALEVKGDPDAARQALLEAETLVAATRNAAREQAPLLEQAASAVVAAETELAIIGSDMAGLETRLGPPDQRLTRQAQLRAEEAQLRVTLESAEARVTSLRPLVPDLSVAKASLERISSVEVAANQQVSQLQVALADLNGHIQARADGAVEEDWGEAREALAAARARVERFKTEIAVLTRLRQELVAARSAARDLYLKPVVSELLPMLGLLFDDIDISFDEETLLPQSVRRNGQDEEVERLSGGMREQLSILTRLAFGRLLARDGRAAPVILDDALVYSDDDRIERMFDALHRQARDQQILVFSCRQRAFARLGGNVLQMVDWTPER
ncbi:MAG: AAA family ATPase [Devosia sp.]|nr:AAA family ATPase [Devosia sp.]